MGGVDVRAALGGRASGGYTTPSFRCKQSESGPVSPEVPRTDPLSRVPIDRRHFVEFGFHVPIAGGLQTAPEAARARGCASLQIFPSTPRGWKPSPRSP